MIRILVFLLFTFSLPVLAEGTILFDPDVKKILDQRPLFANTLYEIFDFDASAVATRIGNEASAKLGGTKIGPYRIKIKKKGTSSDFDRVLVVNTAVTFIDSKGAETEDLRRASSIKEEFIAIEVEPLKK